jgi:hypothetical protein
MEEKGGDEATKLGEETALENGHQVEDGVPLVGRGVNIDTPRALR